MLKFRGLHQRIIIIAILLKKPQKLRSANLSTWKLLILSGHNSCIKVVHKEIEDSSRAKPLVQRIITQKR